MNGSVLPNCRARRNRASEREKKRAYNGKKKKEKTKRVRASARERERERERERKKSSTPGREHFHLTTMRKKRPTSFFFSLSRASERTLSLSPFSSFAHRVWGLNNCDEIFFLLYDGPIELLRVLIRGARIAARQEEDDDGEKDKMKKWREREKGRK